MSALLDWSESVLLYGDGPECSTRQEPKVLVAVNCVQGGAKLSVGCCFQVNKRATAEKRKERKKISKSKRKGWRWRVCARCPGT
jgi:hypothetical protein